MTRRHSHCAGTRGVSASSPLPRERGSAPRQRAWRLAPCHPPKVDEQPCPRIGPMVTTRRVEPSQGARRSDILFLDKGGLEEAKVATLGPLPSVRSVADTRHRLPALATWFRSPCMLPPERRVCESAVRSPAPPCHETEVELSRRPAARTPPSRRRACRSPLAPLARGGGGGRRPARVPAREPRVRRRRCPGADPGGLLGLRDRPPHPGAGGMEQHRRQGVRCAPPLQRLPAYAALELRHRHRPQSLPVAVSRRHQDRRLPDGAAAQGAAPAARQPLHRRRHRPRQDHRGRPHRPRAAAAQEGQDDGGRRPRVRPGAVEGGDGGALRPPLRDPRPRATSRAFAGSGASGSTRGAPTAAFSSRTTSSSTRPGRTPCASGSARCSRGAC